ncbi:spread protein [Micromonospora sp. WMMD712]|uniref:spread protein n=1 Tax=Micromonospora sp. WMMD712 TaxID=3016096 RepID=UPI00249A1315|nr:spread protein [Micromonospora sp. WMMD712]WFE60819.1 spread protein [Micromonospora sp. WMMD712]
MTAHELPEDVPVRMPYVDLPDEPAQDRRFYRLRAPHVDKASVPVTVRVTPDADLYVAVGAGRRRMYLTPAEAWALWRCLSEAVASTGEPPEWIRVHIRPTTR